MALASAVAVGGQIGYRYWTVGRYLESTDDAYVKADYTTVAPKVSGYIVEVLVDDNQRVEAGQALARIDDRDFTAALDQARAELAAAEASIRNLDAQIVLQYSVIDQQKAETAAAVPRTIAEVATRQKEIQYSSRTRATSDRFRRLQKLRCALSSLLEKLPDELRDDADVELLRKAADRHVYSLVQLIYRSREYEGDSKDYEFSRRSMEEHWHAGYHDTVRTLRHPEVLQRPTSLEGVWIFDVARDGRQ